MTDGQRADDQLHPEQSESASTVSRGIVSIYSRLYGRGPSVAKSYVHDDFVLTILEESFTLAERTLLRAGRVRQIEETRRAFQEAVREEFVGVVEEATGRTVETFISQVDVKTETAIELFLLHRDASSLASDEERAP